MSEEEIDVLYNEILNLPKVERPITATTQCEINVNDLFDTIRAFRKIPDYNELIKDNRKKQQEIERLNNIINELDNWLGEKILSWEDDDNVSNNIYHERLAIKMIYYKLQELKEGIKGE